MEHRRLAHAAVGARHEDRAGLRLLLVDGREQWRHEVGHERERRILERRGLADLGQREAAGANREGLVEVIAVQRRDDERDYDDVHDRGGWHRGRPWQHPSCKMMQRPHGYRARGYPNTPKNRASVSRHTSPSVSRHTSHPKATRRQQASLRPLPAHRSELRIPRIRFSLHSLL